MYNIELPSHSRSRAHPPTHSLSLLPSPPSLSLSLLILSHLLHPPLKVSLPCSVTSLSQSLSSHPISASSSAIESFNWTSPSSQPDPPLSDLSLYSRRWIASLQVCRLQTSKHYQNFAFELQR